jgi:uncharacterized membrane protein (DUF106 family)
MTYIYAHPILTILIEAVIVSLGIAAIIYVLLCSRTIDSMDEHAKNPFRW